MSRIGSLLAATPHGVKRFRSAELQHRLRELAASGSYDAAVCSGAYMYVNFAGQFPLPVILDNANVEYRILERYLEHERNPIRRAYASIERNQLKRWERAACQNASASWVCSPEDRRQMAALSGHERIEIVPNVVDIDAFRPESSGEPDLISYTGGMDWYPNRDAVEYFATGVLPHLRRRAPQARLVVAGRGPTPDFRRRFDKIGGVEFTGSLPDIRPALARAAVCVVPLRIGSGTRLKILEAAAMGKAIVSTTIGAEGLDFIDGQEILIADTASALSQALERVLRDESLRRSLGSRARRRVEQCYSLAALRASLRTALPAPAERERVGRYTKSPPGPPRDSFLPSDIGLAAGNSSLLGNEGRRFHDHEISGSVMRTVGSRGDVEALTPSQIF